MAATSQQANALAMVQELQSYGMTKISVINKSYQTIGASAQDAVASAWERTTDVIDEKTGAKTGTQTKTVNENQELANDWSKAKEFLFFKKAFKIQYWADKIKMKNSAGKEVEVCPVLAGIEKTDDAAKMLIFCACFIDCWVIAMTNKSGGSLLAKKQKKGKKKASGYASVQVMIGKLGKWLEEKEEDD